MVEPLRAGARVERPLPATPFVVINGSGNYHHETVLLLESFLERFAQPLVTYVQIDAHPDKETGYRWMIGCASFVGRVLENPRVESVYLLGINPSASLPLDAPFPYIDKLGYYRCDYFAKMRLFSLGGTSFSEVVFDPDARALEPAGHNPGIRRVRKARKKRPADPALRAAATIDWNNLDQFDSAALPPHPIYLTIDLDVLRGWPVTDWRKGGPGARVDAHGLTENQGDMELDVLLALVRRLGAAREILGADICGLTAAIARFPAPVREASLDAVGDVYAAVCDAIARGDQGAAARLRLHLPGA
ncbi:MAG: hypothetical protein IT384_15465 [Deltaproteobacteria bacterium]|nr:hypothetical protein [Deltaproteobacteria bacterium]